MYIYHAGAISPSNRGFYCWSRTETAGGASLDSRAATHGSLLGPTAIDARTAPPNRGRDCSCRAEVRRRSHLHADRRVDNRTSLSGRPPVPRRTRPPFRRPLFVSRAPPEGRSGDQRPSSSSGYYARASPNSGRSDRRPLRPDRVASPNVHLLESTATSRIIAGP